MLVFVLGLGLFLVLKVIVLRARARLVYGFRVRSCTNMIISATRARPTRRFGGLE